MIDYRPNNFGTLFVPEDSLDDNVCVVYVFVKIYDGTSSALDGVAGKCLGLVSVCEVGFKKIQMDVVHNSAIKKNSFFDL